MVDAVQGRAPSARTPWLVAAGIFAGALALYARVAGHPYIFFDDTRYVLENPTVRAGLTWGGVQWAFTTLFVSNWHPLTWLSHMLDVELFGVNPGPHHVVNAVLHAANSALLFAVLLRMTGATWRSAFVAALFAVHPTHVESVAWVAERKDLLSTLFGLLGLLVYASYARRGGLLRYVGVVVLFAASLMSKPMWVTLPFLLLLLDLWPLQRLRASPFATDPEPPPAPGRSLGWLVAEKLPLLALSIASSVVTVIAQNRGGALTGLELGLWSRFGNAAVSYLRYVGKTVWPWPLAIYYPHPVDGVPAWKAAGALILVVALTAMAVWSSRRRPWAGVGWLWFLGTLVPVIGIVQVGGQAMADRYTYFPTIGLYVVTVWGAAELAGRLHATGAAKVAGGIVVVLLAAVSWVQIGLWSDHLGLFRHALAVEDGSGVVHGVLSEGLRRAGRLEEALTEAEAAVQLAPGTARHWNNLAISYRDLRRFQEAREALVQATLVDPAYSISWVNLGLVEMDLGHPSGALQAYERAATLGTEVASAWGNLAVLYHQSGRIPEAARAFQRAVELEPGNASAWFNLGLFRLKTGRLVEAEQALGKAARLDPSNPQIASRLSEARSRMGAGVPR
jgi:Flp pilus assembly protein TadD